MKRLFSLMFDFRECIDRAELVSHSVSMGFFFSEFNQSLVCPRVQPCVEMGIVKSATSWLGACIFGRED